MRLASVSSSIRSVLLASVVAVALCVTSACALRPGTSSENTGSTLATSVSVSHRASDLSPFSDAGTARVSLQEARARAGAGAKVPDPALVGEPDAVILVGEGQLPPAQVGLVLRYPQGAEVYVEPGQEGLSRFAPEQRPEFVAAPGAQVRIPTQTVEWADGRPRHDSIVMINGCKALAVEGGTLRRTIEGRTTIEERASSLAWSDGSTNFWIHSTGASLADLIAIARAIK